MVDYLKLCLFSRVLFEFHVAQKANDFAKYFNRRAECWGLMREWLMAGAEIPDDPELETDLTSPEYLYSRQQQIQLEKKEDMKSRGLASPDCADMFAMTFAPRIAAPRPEPKREYAYAYRGELDWMA